MTDNNHPITPPPELVREWNQAATGTHFPPYGYSEYIATQAARWAADIELEACCEWMLANARFLNSTWIEKLRAARRPKPPSLKEQALKALEHAPGSDYPNPITLLTADEHALIRRALQSLPD